MPCIYTHKAGSNNDEHDIEGDGSISDVHKCTKNISLNSYGIFFSPTVLNNFYGSTNGEYVVVHIWKFRMMFQSNLRVKNSLICLFISCGLVVSIPISILAFFARSRFICKGPFAVFAVLLLLLLLLLYLHKRFRRLYALIKFKLCNIASFDIHNRHMLTMGIFTFI